MPLSLEQFSKSHLCKQLQLPDEDQPQDARDWKQMLREDQQAQYDRYLSQFEPAEEVLHKSGETTLHNTEPVLRKSKNEKWNAYMRKYRSRPKFCPHCGKDAKA